MSNSYKYIEHTSDIAAEIQGDSLEELFSAGANAWLNSAVEEIKFEADDSTEIELSGSTKEELLVIFLNELNYLLVKQKWLCLSVQSIKIFDDEDGCELSAELRGLVFSNAINLKHEIKSVTYHQIEIIKQNGVYSTQVEFDI